MTGKFGSIIKGDGINGFFVFFQRVNDSVVGIFHGFSPDFWDCAI
jgi:hypothetical protein